MTGRICRIENRAMLGMNLRVCLFNICLFIYLAMLGLRVHEPLQISGFSEPINKSHVEF